MNVSAWIATGGPIIMAVGLKIVGAAILYMVGRWLISFAVSMLTRVLTARHLDPTLQRYIANILGVALNIILVVAILGYFGVETTSFACADPVKVRRQGRDRLERRKGSGRRIPLKRGHRRCHLARK